MAELKTKPNDSSVSGFIEGISPDWKKEDGKILLQLMRKITGKAPKMWGTSIIGFGSYHYKYKSGREGDWFLTGFSPRKQNFSIYLMGRYIQGDNLIDQLGKCKQGKGCLYFKRIEDIDLNVLEGIIRLSVSTLKETY